MLINPNIGGKMACYHPITVYRSLSGRNPKTGKWPITLSKAEGYIDKPLVIPCGKCIGCKLEYSRQWAIRISHESMLYENNCFLTLTYDEDHVDPNGSLNKRDIVLFMKRLRRQNENLKIRFFQCGEYGENFERPHHHVCLMNMDFQDKKPLCQSKTGFPLFESKKLQEIWEHGYSFIGGLFWFAHWRF